jgi:hypothetical protein
MKPSLKLQSRTHRQQEEFLMRYLKQTRITVSFRFRMQLKRTNSDGFFYFPKTEMMATANDGERGNRQRKTRNKSSFDEEINELWTIEIKKK